MIRYWLQLCAGVFLLLAGGYGCLAPIPYIAGGATLIAVGSVLLCSGSFSIRRRWHELKRPQLWDIHSALVPHVNALRGMGFFHQYAALSDDELVQVLLKQWNGDIHELARDPASLALLDPASAVHWDTEMDPLPGQGGYTEFLNQLSMISRGYFVPRRITETLTADKGSVDLLVETEARKHRFKLRLNDDWIDPEFLEQLDLLLDDGKYRFCVPNWGGQDRLILCLTESQRQQLRELKWPV